MWEEFDKYLLTLNIEKISEANDDDVIDILRTIKTTDRKYDPDGEKPFFESWVRNNVRKVSPENLKKTARNFGNNIAKICKEQNISSRWNNEVQQKTLDILDLKETENEIKSIM